MNQTIYLADDNVRSRLRVNRLNVTVDRRMRKMVVKLAAVLALGLCVSAKVGATPLDDYVNRFDPTYMYKILSTYRGDNYNVYTVNMTSQTWKPDLQSQPVWWHYLTITVPDTLSLKNAGFLFIEGGDNTDSPPLLSDEYVKLTTLFATSSNSVTGCLKQVPNQPIVFKADPAQQERYEDAVIAWTWKQFVVQRGADPELLLRMPMTKAGVRALDTMNDVTQKMHGASVDRFVVAGASKRGWTTWTVGAVDKRVVAIAPIVMDLLNMVENLHHFYRSLGGWTFEFYDYYSLNFTVDLDSPYILDMAAIIDPMSYNDRYINKPKLITMTGGDEFFMVDDPKFYFDQLKGEKYIRQIPNAEHSLDGYKAGIFNSIRAFYMSVMMGKPLPQMTWKLNTTPSGGMITMMADVTPSSVICYYATTLDGKRKDFRLVKLDPATGQPSVNPVVWYPKSVTILDKNTFSCAMDNPANGWTAFLIQATFPGEMDTVLEFTTQTLVIPDTYPFPDCHGETCRGTLV